MANLRVFVSSTAYDLSILRSSLRSFITSLGYDAVLSEYSDVLYDPSEHTHKNCIAEVATCDMVVLVIGSRFGSTLDPTVLATSLHEMDLQSSVDLEENPSISVTQAEALVAARRQIPLFSFVDAGVYRDYLVYQQNKGADFAEQIVYPSITQPGAAKAIFRFIDYLQGRSFNNAVVTFERLEDILEHLRKQWAALFHRMLSERLEQQEESQRIDRLADQFDDLKAALLATVGDAPAREVARGVIRYRRLLDFLREVPSHGLSMRERVVSGDSDFWKLLREACGIVRLIGGDSRRSEMWSSVFITEDAGALACRLSESAIERIRDDWESFVRLAPSDRGVIFDAIAESPDRLPRFVRRLPQAELHEWLEPNERASREPTSRTLDELLGVTETSSKS